MEWSTEKIEEELLKIIDDLYIDRMPRRREMLKTENGNSLYHAMRRTGGYSYWSEKLQVPYVKHKEYVLFRGDNILAMGTEREIAEQLGLSINTLNVYKSKKRKNDAKVHPNWRVMVSVEGEDFDENM